MIVAISYRKGVIYCEQYDKLDGDYFSAFVRRNFPKMFTKSGKQGSKLFVHDNCPILNCANNVTLFGYVTSRMRDFCKITIKPKHLH